MRSLVESLVVSYSYVDAVKPKLDLFSFSLEVMAEFVDDLVYLDSE